MAFQAATVSATLYNLRYICRQQLQQHKHERGLQCNVQGFPLHTYKSSMGEEGCGTRTQQSPLKQPQALSLEGTCQKNLVDMWPHTAWRLRAFVP
jgi:hypothetical protein